MEIKYRNLLEKEYEGAINFSYNEMLNNNQIEDTFKNRCIFIKLNLLKAYDDMLYLYGAFDNNKLVGVIGYEFDHISILFVNNKYRHKGIATRLLKHATDYYKDNNVKTIKLSSTKEALDFYKKFDFSIDTDTNYDKYIPLKREL